MTGTPSRSLMGIVQDIRHLLHEAQTLLDKAETSWRAPHDWSRPWNPSTQVSVHALDRMHQQLDRLEYQARQNPALPFP